MNDKFKKKLDFWENQAGLFKESQLATAPDIYYRDLEIKSILEYLPKGERKRVLDIGCGNGYSTFIFAKERPDMNFVGVDYSEQMVHYADEVNKKQANNIKDRIKFIKGDVMGLTGNKFLEGQFDYIISERCLINLQNWEEQQYALLELKKYLTPKGKIVLCENTQDGLARLNVMRASLGLGEIKVRWHNYYISEEKLLNFAKENFNLIDVKNIGSLYYIISRVVYAKLCEMEGKEPEYLNPINKVAAQLPYLGNYSPNFIFILENK